MSDDSFYVGYLPMPTKQKVFLRYLVPGLGIFLCAIAILVARAQQKPGNGSGWDPDGNNAIVLQGVITKRGYPLLRFQDRDGSIRTAIVTGMTKSSADERLLFDKALSLKGVMIQQEGRYVFAVLDESDSIQPKDFATDPFTMMSESNLGSQTLQGEIIDPKCYLGAMKPGGGKVHKACAVLCLRGGIPPMFVRRTRTSETYYLVTDKNGEPILEDIIPFVGDPVKIEGLVRRRDDLLIFEIDKNSIRRL